MKKTIKKTVKVQKPKKIPGVNIIHCARCGENHDGLDFLPFTEPVEYDPVSKVILHCEIQFTHWALCPTTGEPILMQVLDDTDRIIATTATE